MAGRATLNDVAREAGVSPATASRSLSSPGQVRSTTLQRVQEAARKLGYVPDAKGRALVSGRTHCVGVVVPTLDSPIFSRALHAMQRALFGGGYQMLVASHEYDSLLEDLAIRNLLAQGVDGLIVVGADRRTSTWDLIDAARIPVVLTWVALEGRDAVAVDNARAGELVGEHLLALGHRTFGVVMGSPEHNDRQRLRLAGLRAALARQGVTLSDSRVIEAPMSLTGGRIGCTALLSLAQMPTAVVGLIDILAVGVLIEAQARGLRVPDSLSVAGIDNLEIAEHTTPPMTTVALPYAEMGRLAAERILTLLDRPEAPRTTLLEVELVERRSTGRPRSTQVDGIVDAIGPAEGDA